jgi:hypothetical protein
MRFPNPLRPITARLRAATWSFFGHRRLRQGDHRGAIRAFHEALRRCPGRFQGLMNVAQAHLCAREFEEARRFLAHARESDPARYDLEAASMLSRCGFDLDAVCRAPAHARPAPLVPATAAATAPVTSAHLPFGDCRDVDEYARFRAMPPITSAEIEGMDWDHVLGDLLDE